MAEILASDLIGVIVKDTTATASDVRSGKIFFTATGMKETGTGSGGGTDVSDTTAVAGDVIAGKIFHIATGASATGTITSKAADTITPGTADQVIAAGQYLGGAQTVKGDVNLTAGNIKKDVTIFGVTGTLEGKSATVVQPVPAISVSATGLITASYTPLAGDVSDTTEKSATEQLAFQAATTWMPTTADQTIASGKYLTGDQTIKGDANLLAGNIAKDVTIFGVTGTLEGGGTVVTDTTAVAADVLSGKKFHLADGSLTTGTIATVTQPAPTVSIGTDGTVTASHTSTTGYVGTAATSTATASVAIDAAKVLYGQSIYGTAGTATGDADAEASDILPGKTAYVKGSKVTGSSKTSLTVTTNPTTGEWSIDDGATWYSSGHKVSDLAPGTYTIKFKQIADKNTPDPVKISLPDGREFSHNQVYPDPSSKLMVKINNAPTGAGYTIDSDATIHTSEEIVNLSPGSHTIKFVKLSGYLVPSNINVVAVRDGKLVYGVSYHESDYAIYGVRYIQGDAASSPKMKGLVVDLDTGNKRVLGDDEAWEALPAHNFRKCLLKNGAVNYYLSPSDSTKKADGTAAVLTGADGDVMVEIPPVYFSVENMGTDSATGGTIYDWMISKHPFPGSRIHPFFYVGRTSATDTNIYTQYLGAYESVICTKSTGVGISTAGITAPITYTSGTHSCRSIKGFKPVTNMTLAQFREAHVAAGLHSMNSLAMQFIALMMFVEYRTLDSQDSGTANYDTDRGCAGNRSDGFVWYNASFAYQYVRKTGRADAFGNKTGEVQWNSTTDYTGDSNSLPDNFVSGATLGKKVVGFTYRGIENPFGHIFKFEDGILTDSTGYYWTPVPSLYTSDLTTAQSTYTKVTHTWPASGYIKFFTFTEEEPTFFATTTGGSSTTYLPDYFWNNLGEIANMWGYPLRAGYLSSGGNQFAGICPIRFVKWTGFESGSRSAYAIIASL